MNIDQRYLHEFLLAEAGIEVGHCIGMDPEEVSDRLLKGLFVGIATNGVLKVTVKPFDDELDSVGPSDFDVGEGYEVKRVLQVDNGQIARAVDDTRQALCIAVSRAFEGLDVSELREEHLSPLHASEAQRLLVASGLPWEPWDVRALQMAAYSGATEGELDDVEAELLVRGAERLYLDRMGAVR